MEFVKRGDRVAVRVGKRGAFDLAVEGVVREVCYSGYATVVARDGAMYIARDRVGATGLTNVRIIGRLCR